MYIYYYFYLNIKWFDAFQEQLRDASTQMDNDGKQARKLQELMVKYTAQVCAISY